MKLTIERYWQDRGRAPSIEERSVDSEEALASLVRSVSADWCTIITFYVGDVKVLMNASGGRYAAFFEEGELASHRAYDLVGAPEAKGLEYVVYGGQTIDVPKRFLFDASWAVAVAEVLFRSGNFRVLNWEEQKDGNWNS